MKSKLPLSPTPSVNITSTSVSGHQPVVYYNFHPFSEHIELIPSPITSFPIVAFLCIWFLSCCCHPHSHKGPFHLNSGSSSNNFLASLPDSSLSRSSIQLVHFARFIFLYTVFIKFLSNFCTPTAFCIHSKCLHLALRTSHLLTSFFHISFLPHFINPIFHFSLFPNRATPFSQANLLTSTPICNLLLCTSYSFACTVLYPYKAFTLSVLGNCTSTFLTSSFKI